MKFRSVKYYLREAFVSVARNRLMSLSSVVTVAACIFILIFSICIAVNLDYVLEKLEQAGGIMVTISDEATQENVLKLFETVEGLEHVLEAEYISADAALADFASRLSADEGSGILEKLSEDNPMRRYISVKMDSARNAEEVIRSIEAMDGVVRVRHAQDFTAMLISINNVVRIVSIVMILILSLLSVIIIMNTIKLTVNSRKTEITIMKYVGATEWFIKWPFIIEGIIIGVSGAVIPIVISWFVYDGAIEALQRNIAMLTNIVSFKEGIELFPVLIPLALLLGAVIGTLGSVTSMRRYLSA